MSKFKNIAVLIDADNIGSSKIDWVFSQIQTLGTITTKRIYGDFAKSHLSSWEGAILKYAIEKKHQTSYSTGKNSSDIALAIDAMDLLYTNQCDAFCIISSDSDFIGLALRLRRTNIQVFGFGENKTIKEFRQVCSQFFEIGNNSQSKSNTTINPPKNTTESISTIKKFTENELKGDTKLLNALRESIINNLSDDWANYGTVNTYLIKNFEHIQPKFYGYSKWSDIITMINLFEVELRQGGLFVRLKNNTSKNEVTQKYTANKLKQDVVLISAIRDSINQNLVNGWADYSHFHTYLNKNFPKLKVDNYGYSKWRSLIEQIGLFEFESLENKLFIRENINNKKHVETTEKNQTIKLNHQQLLNDVLQIINSDNSRTDEWSHISHLGGQLKNKGYQPKEFGFKSFTDLLRNVKGMVMNKKGSTIYFTLSDKSKIKPITSNKENLESFTEGIEESGLYKLLIHNKIQITNKIKVLLERDSQLKFYDLWKMVHTNLPSHIVLSDKESWEYFMYFFKKELVYFSLKSYNDVLYITYRLP